MTETDIQITDCIDYLRFTIAHGVNFDNILPPFPSLSRTGEILDRAHYGYNRKMPLEGGGQIMWHSEHEEMKICVELEGMALAELRRDGFDVEAIMHHAQNARLPMLHYNRIDYAIDILNAGVKPIEVWNKYEKGKVKTTARKARFLRSYESDTGADTVEFGSRESSPRFIRIYDKGAKNAQMGALWTSFLRIELEEKGVRVNPFAHSVLRYGRSETGRREIGEAVSMKLGWFNEALKGDLAPHIEVPRPDSQPNRFVLNHIIPFLKNHSHELTQETKAKLLTVISDYVSMQ